MLIKKPVISSPYRSVYTPAGDVYRGVDTDQYKNGEFYIEWLANDFTIIKKDGTWHAYGITHPRPAGFTDTYNFKEDIHEAEFQLFHSSWTGSLGALYNGGTMAEHEKILYPQQRGGINECHAPCIVERDGVHHLFWGPRFIRSAQTTDMFHFTVRDGFYFEGSSVMRDPYIFEEDGTYTMIVVETDGIRASTSTDLLDWSAPRLFHKNPFADSSSTESPCLIKRHGMYYLFWSIWDDQNGAYDERTYVFASSDLDGFNGLHPIAMVDGHAVEIVQEDGQDYIISVFYPQNGLNMARLDWI